MLIDCDGCAARGAACTDCVLTVLLGPSGESHPAGTSQADPWALEALDDTDRRALTVLADAGLVPRLRHQRAG